MLIIAHIVLTQEFRVCLVSLQEKGLCYGGGIVLFLMGHACLFSDSCMSKYTECSCALTPTLSVIAAYNTFILRISASECSAGYQIITS